MQVVVCPDAQRVGEVAAARIGQVIDQVGPEVVLGVATGSSPMGVYESLAKRVRAGDLDLSRASAFALDEYVGLPKGHPESYAEVVRTTVTEPLGMDPAKVHCPDGFREDLANAGPDYEAAIAAAGGVDVQILGVGSNGHIGFNEPTSSFASRTRVKTLARTTRLDNQRFFNSLDEVPTHCLTQGLGTILDARNVVLVAQGANKAHAIAGVVEGPMTAMVPGSILQMHPRATIVVDEEAASELTLLDYYRDAYPETLDWL
ncbi:glucosamine-6-phosphate deaminase [Enemella sp. A6]|uniref:glucosamine-6-phosphate deaminase n=1 Tax=Enemella sp. A6 TaxID=3440152 RepID=UPI003EBAC25C